MQAPKAGASKGGQASEMQIHKCQVCQTVYKTKEQLKDHKRTPEHAAKVVSAAQNYQEPEAKPTKS